MAMTENPAHHRPLARPVTRRGAVDATVAVPGSKSVTNRALVLAALAAEPGWLRRPLRSRDTLLMAEALRALGVGIEEGVGPDGTRRGLARHPRRRCTARPPSTSATRAR